MAPQKLKKDLAFFLIEQATGMKPGDFLKSFKNLPANQKSKLISKENISDAFRLLSEKTDDELDYMKNILMGSSFVNQRVALRQHYANNAGLKKFSTKIKNAFDEAAALPKYKDGRSPPADISLKDLQTFAGLYNAKNPFLNKQIKSVLGEDDFSKLQRRAQTLGLISKSTTKFHQDLAGAIFDEAPIFDQATLRAANILKEYKKRVPLTTGSELRQGTYNFGYIDTIKLFETDPILKAYINAPSRQGGSPTGLIFTDQVKGAEDIIKRRKNKILKALKEMGVLDDLNLSSINLTSGPPRVNLTDNPKVKAFILEEAKAGNPNLIGSNMTKILDDNQKFYFDEFLKTFRKNMYDSGLDTTPLMREFGETNNHANRATDLIRSNFNRYMRFGLIEGKDVDELFDGFKKQVESKDFMKKAMPIFYETERLRDKIKYNFSKYGIEFPEVSLSHQSRVIDHIDRAFKANNLFTGFRKLNAEEQALQSKITALKSRIQQRGGSKLVQSDETVRNLQKELNDLEYQLESGGYYEPVPKDFDAKMDQALTDISTGASFLFKDGGFATIEDVLGYSNE